MGIKSGIATARISSSHAIIEVFGTSSARLATIPHTLGGAAASRSTLLRSQLVLLHLFSLLCPGLLGQRLGDVTRRRLPCWHDAVEATAPGLDGLLLIKPAGASHGRRPSSSPGAFFLLRCKGSRSS